MTTTVSLTTGFQLVFWMTMTLKEIMNVASNGVRGGLSRSTAAASSPHSFTERAYPQEYGV